MATLRAARSPSRPGTTTVVSQPSASRSATAPSGRMSRAGPMSTVHSSPARVRVRAPPRVPMVIDSPSAMLASPSSFRTAAKSREALPHISATDPSAL